jgi:predicted nucleotidyltransferase
MRIQTDGIIVGQPALAIRNLLQRERGTIATIAELLNIDSLMARQVYQELATEGYIEPSDRPFEADEGSWQTTRRGNALAHATARRAITRQTAERLIQEFLHRIREINACDDYVYRISRVIIFGSYLSDKSRLGDVDLSIVLEFRENDPDRRIQHIQDRIKRALQEGRYFQSISATIAWPQQEIFRFLKGRSPSLSLHDEQIEQVLTQPIPSKILFDAAVDQS